MSILAPTKDPNNIEPYYFVWCDKTTGLNDGSASDHGELQGETIASYSLTVGSGITKDSDSKNSGALSLRGVSYSANTVVTVWLSGGTADADYEITCRIVTSGAIPRTLDRTMKIPVRSQ